MHQTQTKSVFFFFLLLNVHSIHFSNTFGPKLSILCTEWCQNDKYKVNRGCFSSFYLQKDSSSPTITIIPPHQRSWDGSHGSYLTDSVFEQTQASMPALETTKANEWSRRQVTPSLYFFLSTEPLAHQPPGVWCIMWPMIFQIQQYVVYSLSSCFCLFYRHLVAWILPQEKHVFDCPSSVILLSNLNLDCVILGSYS